MTDKLPTYGGQAVIEGVMMRGAHSVAIAMRSPTNEIVIHTEPLSVIYRNKFMKLPFLRGIVALWDALGLGMRALTMSANVQTGEDEKIEGPALFMTIGIALAVGIGVFFLSPALAGQLGENLLRMSAWWSNLVEGILRLGLLIGYVWVIGKMPEIRRVFAYHGAEHKTINAFEDGADLTPESVARYPLEHTRCGTAFLLTLMLMSVLVFSVMGPMPMAVRLISRVVLLPVLAALAYEYIRWTAQNLDSPIIRFLVKPNLALQRLTTREPSLEMLEVSIAAFTAMRNREAEIKVS